MSFPWRRCQRAAAGSVLLSVIGCENPGKVDIPAPETQIVVRTDTVFLADTVFLSRRDTLRVTDTVYTCPDTTPELGNVCPPDPPYAACSPTGHMLQCRDGRWGHFVVGHSHCIKDSAGTYRVVSTGHLGFIGIDKAVTRRGPMRMLRGMAAAALA